MACAALFYVFFFALHSLLGWKFYDLRTRLDISRHRWCNVSPRFFIWSDNHFDDLPLGLLPSTLHRTKLLSRLVPSLLEARPKYYRLLAYNLLEGRMSFSIFGHLSSAFMVHGSGPSIYLDCEEQWFCYCFPFSVNCDLVVVPGFIKLSPGIMFVFFF